MTEPRTLHEGGTGLGADDTDAETKPHCTYCIMAYGENRMLHKAVLAQDEEIAALHTKLQWRTWFVAIAYIAGFLSCAALTWFGSEAMR